MMSLLTKLICSVFEMCEGRLHECNVILDYALKINVYNMANALRV